MKFSNQIFLIVTIASSFLGEAHALLGDLLGPQAKCKDVVICQGDTLLAADVDAGSSDPDGLITAQLLNNYGPFLSIGVFNVVLTVKDDHGLLSVCTANVNVRDCSPVPAPAPVAPPPTNLPPRARCKDATVCQGGTISVSDINNGSRDRDGSIVFMNLSKRGPFLTLGPVRVVLVVKDNEGAKGKCRATVTVKDCALPISTDPVSLCKNATVCVGVAVKVGDINNGSYDPLGGILSNNLSCGPFAATGTQQCVLSVTSTLGVSSQCTSTINVVDCATAPAPAPAPTASKDGCLLGQLLC